MEMRVGLRAAAKRVEITPPGGCTLSGGAFGRAMGVADPLFARGLMLDGRGGPILLVSCDLLGLTADQSLSVRQRMSRRCGAPVDRILVAATHTHGGPNVLDMRAWGRSDPAYLEWLGDRFDELAGTLGNLRPAAVRAGAGCCPGLAVNRTSYGGGLVDEDLAVLSVEEPDGRPIGLVLNYGCHPVTMHCTGLVSADYPGQAERELQVRLRTDAPVLFLTGPCGDVNPATFRFDPQGNATPAGRQRCRADAAAFGGALAACAEELLRGTRPAASVPLGCIAATVSVPLQPLPSETELAECGTQARRLMAGAGEPSATNWRYCEQATFAEWAEAAARAVREGRAAAAGDHELQGLRIGPAVVLAIPGELFCRFGREIRAAGGGRPVMVATQANGSAGYFPVPEAYRAGKYEATMVPRILGLQAFAPDCGERICAAGVQIVRRLAGRADRARR